MYLCHRQALAASILQPPSGVPEFMRQAHAVPPGNLTAGVKDAIRALAPQALYLPLTFREAKWFIWALKMNANSIHLPRVTLYSRNIQLQIVADLHMPSTEGHFTDKHTHTHTHTPCSINLSIQGA